MSILKCQNPKCASIDTPAAKFQTKEHGAGMRVHNPAKGDRHGCTICGHYILNSKDK